MMGFKIVAAGWSDFSGNEFVKPGTGNVFVAVDLVVINSKDVPIEVSEALEFSLTTGNGKTHRPDAVASLTFGKGTVGGVVSPGERIRGVSVFEIPAGEYQWVNVGDIVRSPLSWERERDRGICRATA